jgi:hypothetical protein
MSQPVSWIVRALAKENGPETAEAYAAFIPPARVS